MKAWILSVAIGLLLAAPARAQTLPPESKTVKNHLINFGKTVFDLFQKPIHPTLEGVAPTAGVTAGIGFSPKPWRTDTLIKTVRARASASVRKYWAIDASAAWQQSNSWRIEPYVRLREMNQLNFFGLGNKSELADRSTFALLERRMGVYGWKRPVPPLAIGGRGEVLWPRATAGKNDDLPPVEQSFAPSALPGFMESSNFVHLQAFSNFNYPWGRNERPRRGGDYRLAWSHFQDVSGTRHSFQRIEVEGQERFPILSRENMLTFHVLLSMSRTSSTTVPFYMMDTLGGADNLRGFREDIIGSDQTNATLRAFESFRFRDANSVLLQTEFRRRVWSQVFVGVFGDMGAVAGRAGELSSARLHRGAGVSLSVFRANALAVRLDWSFVGGEGRHVYFATGQGIHFQ